MCSAGVCIDAERCREKDCSDDNDCTDDVCDPETGDCSNPEKPDGAECEGGQCKAGQCVGLCEGVDCWDDNPCTSDACDPKTGSCPHTPLEDGTPCKVGSDPGRCENGVCWGLCDFVVCDDKKVCTTDRCDRTNGRCIHTDKSDGTACPGGQCRGGVCTAEPGPCDGVQVDLSTSAPGTWASSSRQQAAWDTLRFTAYVRASKKNSIVAIGDRRASTWDDNVALVRFNERGTFDLGTAPSPSFVGDRHLPYTLGRWYRVTVEIDLYEQTYTARVGFCDETQEAIHSRPVAFRSEPQGGLEHINIWSQSGRQDVADASWSATGSADCSGLVPDLTSTDGTWENSSRQPAAWDTLTFTTYARASRRNSIVAIGDRRATTWNDNVALVRFNGDGYFDLGTAPSPTFVGDRQVRYGLAQWYKITFDIDVTEGSYTAKVGSCDDTQQAIHSKPVAFRSEPDGGLEYYNLWSQSGRQDAAEVRWKATGSDGEFCRGKDCMACTESGCLDASEFGAAVADALFRNAVGYAVVIAVKGARGDGIPVYGGYARLPTDNDSRRMTVDDRMQTGSLSKTITAAAALQLLEARGLSVDVPMARHLPPDWQLGENVDSVSFADLLRHESGFRDWYGTTFADLKELVRAGVRAEHRGTYHYSSQNFALFRMIIPRLAGSYIGGASDEAEAYAQAYLDYVNARVLASSAAPSASCSPSKVPVLFYTFPAGPPPGYPLPDHFLKCGGYGWRVSALEYSRFLYHLVWTDEVLSDRQKGVMRARKLGWFPITWKGNQGFTHGGGMKYKNQSGHVFAERQTNYFVFPELGVLAVAFVNSGVEGSHVATVIREAFYAAWEPIP